MVPPPSEAGGMGVIGAESSARRREFSQRTQRERGAEMSDVVSCSVVGMLSGGSIVLAQTLPGVPEDLKSWPVTAILGLITLLALIGTFYTIWRMFALQEKQTVALTRSVDAQVETRVALSY
jgi:hypothetical protein